tara:strand:+ start:1149 stop:1322 length:174 start_codon:yes stop_codon:yes gene_type:complete
MTDLSKVNMLELLAELEKRGSFKTIIFNKTDGKQEIAAILPLYPMTITNQEVTKEEE